MRQHLDTIPLWDAYKAGGECPLCDIRAANEESYVENFLGGSVMEPATRVEVNQKGFCGRHFQMLYAFKNRLGLALMTDTYLKETIARLEAGAAAAAPQKGAFLRRARTAEAASGPALNEGCILCERLDETMRRYALTLCYLWKREPEFRAAFAGSKGLCLLHYAQVQAAAPEELSGAELNEFTQTLNGLEIENLRRVEKDLEWFTLKFDYRNQDKPWGESRDAVERALNKLRGKVV